MKKEQDADVNKQKLKEIDMGAVATSLKKLAEAVKEEVKDTENKPKFRFYDTRQRLEDILDEETKTNKALNDIGFLVEVLENIECFDVTKEKRFNIRITDSNDTYVEFPLDSYMKIVDSFTDSVEDFICEKINIMTGGRESKLSYENDGKIITKRYNTKMIADLIAEELSYLVYFNELQTKTYKAIGWDEYNNFLIFKYDGIYANTVFLKGKCISDFAEDIVPAEEVGFSKGDIKEKDTEKENKCITWFTTMQKVMNGSATASLILAAGISGLVREILPYTKETNINMNIVGERASGKSTICHLLLSIFGDPTKLEASFLDTDNSMEIARAEKPVLPYVLDERMLRVEGESTEKKKHSIIISVFQEYEGKVKERLGGSYKSISGNRTTGPVISSSVESMLDILLSGKDLGQFRRFIELELTSEMRIFESKKMAEKAESVAYSCYGYGIRMIIDYMLYMGTSIEQLTDYFKNRFEKYNDIISKQIDEMESAKGMNGLSSSSKRLALIVLSYEVLRNSLLFWISRNLEIANSEGVDLYHSGIEVFKPFNEMIDSDEIIENKIGEISTLLLDNLFNKMESVAALVPVKEYWDYIEKNRDAFWDESKQRAWPGSNRAEYIGKIQETQEEYIIKLLGKRNHIEYLVLERVAPDKIKQYITLKEGKLVAGKGKEAEATAKFNALTPKVNENSISLFLQKNKDISIEFSGKAELFAKDASNSTYTILKIKKPSTKVNADDKSKKKESENENK
ncbi:DUF927 domain-containing protein [Eisenbergiella tayi]|uniref:DUF927 domain-containing protein n=1 Tax=Eisenbergiella tayi TaxID=1432052 RepID=UPI0008486AA1|nr:DUF927 domain-containing protein [Eisenbergiella tayi]ODR38508.1 hypothetical protein BEI60_08565 [Eisenbergiella tayi]